MPYYFFIAGFFFNKNESLFKKIKSTCCKEIGRVLHSLQQMKMIAGRECVVQAPRFLKGL
jgi:hypothetical protein